MNKLKLLFLVIFIVLGNIGCNTNSKPDLSLDIYTINILLGEEIAIKPKIKMYGVIQLLIKQEVLS